jgi:hypothetical protein
MSALKIGDICRLSGRPNVFFAYAGRDTAKHKRVPEEWGLFIPSDPEWGAQLTTLASASFVARPDWAAGMKCRWNEYNAVVMGITETHLHLAWGSSVAPVPIADATAANIDLFLTQGASI